jgi:lipoprotein-releasing system permease protein
MFELSVALKYLVPKKRLLSTSLISLTSIFVISLVVWLILVFLSVTSGIEKNWIKKLTTLNAPLRIIPTEKYYNSYYYQIDRLSENSNYSTKTIGEKSSSLLSDSYNPSSDIEVPHFWPKAELNKDGSAKDLVKILFNLLDKRYSDLTYQDFEVNGALMRLSLYRSVENKEAFYPGDEKLSFISQMSYLLSHTENNPDFSDLSFPPDLKDLNNLLSRLDKSSEDIQKESPTVIFNHELPVNELVKKLHRFFDHIEIKKMVAETGFNLPLSFFPKKEPIQATGILKGEEIAKIIVSESGSEEGLKGIVLYEKGSFLFKPEKGGFYKIDRNTQITLGSPLIFDARVEKESLDRIKKIEDLSFILNGKIQGKILSGKSSLRGLKIYEANLKTHFDSLPSNEPFWAYSIKSPPSKPKLFLPRDKEVGVLLPKSLKESGVLIGDKGYFSFAAKTAISMQEQRLPFYVAGFYDPGVLSVGSRCIIVPMEILRTISKLNSSFAPEGIPSNGIFLWTKDLPKVDQIKLRLIKDLEEKEISSYWKVQTYKEYEFAKDLMQQFQSDKMLFILIALIIIIVACSNIISLLVFLVNDKKKEIAVLQAMGASKKSIALIFGSCGVIMGLSSSILGSLAALLTIRHIDFFVNILSAIQGHAAFNAAFFGESLPNALSWNALIFIVIVTPIISLLAGLFPAIKATKMNPSQILRGN